MIAGGATLDFVRQRLAARAEEIGWKPQRDVDLHLTVDGRIVRPLAEDGSAAFLFRADAKDVRLMSNTFVPTALGSSDRRILGVMLQGLALSGSGGEPRRISLDDQRLSDGVHDVEERRTAPLDQRGVCARSPVVGGPLRADCAACPLRPHDGPRLDRRAGARQNLRCGREAEALRRQLSSLGARPRPVLGRAQLSRKDQIGLNN